MMQMFGVFCLLVVVAVAENTYDTQDGVNYKVKVEDNTQDHSGYLNKIFKDIDKNGDNIVDKKELIPWLELEFEQLAKMNSDWDFKNINKNNDDHLTWNEVTLDRFQKPADELKEFVSKKEGLTDKLLYEYEKSKFKICDKNKDEKLSKNEHFYFINSNAFLKEFEIENMWLEYDLNRDGKVTLDEIYHPEFKLPEQTEKEHKETDKAFFDSRDQNKDGILDYNEVKEMVSPIREDQANDLITDSLEKFDTNNDGKYSKSEWENAHEAMSLFENLNIVIPALTKDDVEGPPKLPKGLVDHKKLWDESPSRQKTKTVKKDQTENKREKEEEKTTPEAKDEL